MNCTFNISLHFVTLVAFVEKNLKRNRVVLCHAVQVDYTVGIPNFSNRANLIIEVFLTFRGYFWCFLFLTGIDLWWNPAIFGHALFSGCWIFTDSDLLTRTNMVGNGGLCWTERLLTHNVKCHWFWFFSFYRVDYSVQQILFCRWSHVGRSRGWRISCRISWGSVF